MDTKTILITGATRGIGRYTALSFAREGYNIAVNYRDLSSAESLREEIEALGARALIVKADIQNSVEVDELFKQAIEKFGSIDIVINNAGATKDKLAIQMSDEDYEYVIDINLNGTFYCMRAAAKHMLKKRRGRIISISSIVGLHGNPGQINYTAAKAGIIAMTKTLALELASRNITVNAIAPGFINTEMTAKLSEDAKKALTDRIPLKRQGDPQDIVNAIKFLASDEASYITGQVLSVDGGMNI